MPMRLSITGGIVGGMAGADTLKIAVVATGQLTWRISRRWTPVTACHELFFLSRPGRGRLNSDGSGQDKQTRLKQLALLRPGNTYLRMLA